MKLYIAGPMRGYKDFNFPAFDAAAKRLRRDGHEVISPAEMDREQFGDDMEKLKEIGSQPNALKDFMTRDLPALLSCDAIVMLTGWEKSQGACLEAFTAAMTGMPVYIDEGLRNPISIYRLYVIIGEKITGA